MIAVLLKKVCNRKFGRLAQLVEHGHYKPRVVGSSPSSATKFKMVINMGISAENKVRREKAIELRMQGMSLTEITRIIPSPRNTIYCWIKNVPLTEEQKHMIGNKTAEASRANQKLASQKMCEKYAVMRNDKFQEGVDFINQFKVIPSDICAAVSLYWAEGKKTNAFCMVNSDSQVILIFKKFIENHMKVPKEKIKVHLNFYDNVHTVEQVETYWQNLLNLDASHFYKSQVNNKPQEKAGTKIGKLPYGVCTLGCGSTLELQKMLGMIDALQKRILK